MQKLVCSILCAGVVATLPPSAVAADPKASRFYEDALKRYEKKDMEGAIIQLKNAIQQDRQLLAAHVLLGKALLNEGDPQGAEVEFNEALKLGVSRVEVVVPLAKAYMLQGKQSELIDRITSAGLPQNLQVDVLVLRGNAYAELNNQPAAMRSFEEARALDPRSVPARLAQASLFIRNGQVDQAATLIDEAMKQAPNDAGAWAGRATLLHVKGDVQGALAAYGKSLSIDPANLDARVARAGLLMELDRVEEAAKDVAEVQNLFPADPRGAYLRAVVASRKNDAAAVQAALGDIVGLLDPVPINVLSRNKQMLLLAGLAHHGLGDREKAKAYLSAYLRQFPKEAGPAKVLASIYLDSGEQTRAIILLEPLQKLYPNDSKILSLLAAAHMADRHYREASAFLEQAVKASGGAADARADLGLSLLGAGQGDVGINQLQQALAKDPGQAQAGIALAMLHMRKNQHKQALELMESVVKRNPENLTALNLLGSIRAATGDFAGGRKAFEQVLLRDERFYGTALNLARLDGLEGKADSARSRLAKLLKTDPNNTDAMFEMALLEERGNNIPEAVRWLEKARALPKGMLRSGLYLVELHLRNRSAENALSVAKEVSGKAPGNLAALSLVARAQIALGDTRSARQTLGDMTRFAAYDAPQQVEVARLQRIAGNDSGAAYSLEKALNGSPDYLPAQSMLAEIEIAKGDYGKAEQRIRGILQKYPAESISLRLQGDLALARRQFTVAINSYQGALAKGEGDDVVLRIYQAHVSAGDNNKGLKFLDDWVRSHPNNSVILRALGDGYLTTGNLPAARKAFERLQQQQPANPDVLNNLAQTLLKQGDKGALPLAEQAYRLASKNPGVIDTLGWILLAQGQLERSMGYLRDARLRDPANPEIRYHLAVALAKSGRKSEARDELVQILKDGSAFDGIEDARRLQRELGY